MSSPPRVGRILTQILPDANAPLHDEYSTRNLGGGQAEIGAAEALTACLGCGMMKLCLMSGAAASRRGSYHVQPGVCYVRC